MFLLRWIFNYVVLLRFGPLVRCWCMRFEGKHNYFKDFAHRVKCYKNISKSLANHHQNMMCYYFGTTTPSSLFDSTGVGAGMYCCTLDTLVTKVIMWWLQSKSISIEIENHTLLTTVVLSEYKSALLGNVNSINVSIYTGVH